MILKNSVRAAVAAAALTFSLSGAQAQYRIIPATGNSSTTILPYGGYYGPSISLPPIINYGGSYFDQPYGFSFGYYGYSDQGYGYGYYGSNTYSGDVNNPASGVGPSTFQNINGVLVQGGVIDPTRPTNVPPAASGEADASAANVQNGMGSARALRPQVSLVSVRRAPYNRVAISYNGSTNGVTSITMMLLDGRKREVQQMVLTNPPAQTLLRRPSSAHYYRVVLDYANGTQRTITHPLNGR